MFAAQSGAATSSYTVVDIFCQIIKELWKGLIEFINIKIATCLVKATNKAKTLTKTMGFTRYGN